MEYTDFSRILMHLRKDKGISQKKAADDLGVSQSLLSHYEKGIRECGLMFLIRAADYYNVTVDYLLGRSYDKNGTTISLDELPDENAVKGNTGVRSMLPTLNKKLISNSISIIMDTLSKIDNKNLTTEVSSYLSVAVYKMFRMLYNSNNANPKSLFGADESSYTYMSDASMNQSQAKIQRILNEMSSDEKDEYIKLDEQSLITNYPSYVSSLHNLLQNTENKIGARKK